MIFYCVPATIASIVITLPYTDSLQSLQTRVKPIMMSDDYGMIARLIIQSKKSILLEKINSILNIVRMYFTCNFSYNFIIPEVI